MKSSLVPFDIIVYGGPGSGKSTQAKFLVKKLKAHHMNMGGLLREVIAKRRSGYRKIKPIVENGKLVPAGFSSALVGKFIAQTPSSGRIVFDGFPRSPRQITYLNRFLKKAKRDAVMVFIDLPVKVAKDRLVKRATLENRSDDAKPKVINERIEVFHNQAKKVTDYYKKHHRLIAVNGDQTIDQVKKDISDLIKKYESSHQN